MAELPRYLSATSITLYRDCPNCWRKRYVDKDRDAGIGHMGRLFYGQAMAAALQDVHAGESHEKAWAHWYQHFNDLASGRNEGLPQTFDWGLRSLNLYMLDRYVGEPEYTTWPTISGQLIMGKMDLLRFNKKGQPHSIVEFKTSAAKWDQARVDKELQATIYWEGFTQEFGYPPQEVRYVIFPTSGDPAPFELSTIRTEADSEGIQRMVSEVVKGIEGDHFSPRCRDCRIEAGLLIPKTHNHPVFLIEEEGEQVD